MSATPELPSKYDPQASQDWCLKFWNEGGYFHSNLERGKKRQKEGTGKGPFTIVIPPPNVTGALHMGHALDNTLQDVLIRWRRMQGYEACWIPGTDHAGIATQAVVEKRLLETEKLTRHDVKREGLVERIWKWKDQYECRILGQLKQLGCSADWDRTRFTLDEMCSKAVRQTFFNFFKAGLIYRGKRLVNWDTHLQTAVADDEIYHEKTKGHFWTFKYPVVDDAGKQTGEYLTFSTTRPETMLADVAVAIHPEDERYKHLHGKKLLCPLVNRIIPIVTDGLLVDPTLGTGAVKVTPAHDPNDYQCGLRHKLEMLSMMKADGTISEVGGKYQGLTMPEARKAVVADMEALGLLEKLEDREIDMAHSDRSKTPIEPFLSDQWFVKMSDNEQGAAHEVSGSTRPGLAQLAMDAVTTGRVKFFPERYAKTYLDWLSEKRDWCISRQLWWGHRIPIWSKIHDSYTTTTDGIETVNIIHAGGGGNDPASEITMQERAELDAQIEAEDQLRESQIYRTYVYGENTATEQICVRPGNPDIEKWLEVRGYKQDPDVLDTWFSSGLWPHSTLGWPDKTPEMAYYYPTSVLVTSRDIITLWVARMVLMSLSNIERIDEKTGEKCKEIPFEHVYIHPKVLDGFGEGMSKSKGNGVDPLDVISIYGTDALRFVICSMATETQDARMPVANVCPHCQTLVPVKNEHMYMRTKKLNCPSCKKPFRPGGPWPSEDPELPTAKQTSEKFELGRNFTTKLWNASRFVMMNLSSDEHGGLTPSRSQSDLKLEDRWILSRLATVTEQVTKHLELYEMAAASRILYEFTWSEFCDWYLEMAKSRLKDPAEKPLAQQMLAGVLDTILRLLHPMMPFVTEMIWQSLNNIYPQRALPAGEGEISSCPESIMIAEWPSRLHMWRDVNREAQIARMQDLIKAIRNTRNEYRVDEKATVTVSVKCTEAVAKELESLKPFIHSLAKVGELHLGNNVERPTQAGVTTHADFTAYVHLAGLIDVPAEIKRMEKQ
ncbi:MAG TPA: valine--tRNA ligase, partial [Gemmatales bacterium]|nr:valine--tRNA ligase [Gemmatales bacterium]